ncbi:arylsulfotransferase family protein [Streptomyces sp. NPDC056773]|uniref:arylsulfotransferase family protein n=1 Tax=unclassified Streptomyces TaxID=2593676 RepID=UPI0036CBA6AD
MPLCNDLFVFSPSASYPRPFAAVIDDRARIVHAWSSPIGQPDIETSPPSYLRGWNHVEVAPDGSLFAIVPLHALLKLAADSTLIWRADLPVHHDLDLGPHGEIYVLTEEPRPVPCNGGGSHVLLDNSITVLGPDGQLRAAHSLYEILTTDPALSTLIANAIDQHRDAGRTADTAVLTPRLEGANGWRRGRDVSRLLRSRPGSPSDILHTNTLEILSAHPTGLWAAGDVLVSLRDLDLIAVLDLRASSVRWWWGPGELSGQHQPSAQPGGTILIFDNGRHSGRSRILEIEPVTRTVVWKYEPGLYCEMAGGCERLADGTILISDAQAGHGLIVDRDGRKRWQVQVSTSTTGTRSRAAFYRLSAIPGDAAHHLGTGDRPARTLTESRVRCQLVQTVRGTL